LATIGIFSCLACETFAQDTSAVLFDTKLVDDPVEDFARPFKKDLPVPALDERSFIKLSVDLNGDSVADVAICDSYIAGNGGGSFSIYLGTKFHHYLFVGVLDFWPGTLHVQPLGGGKSKLVVYGSSGFTGKKTYDYGYAFYELSSDGIRELGYKRRSIPLDNNNEPVKHGEPQPLWEKQLPPRLRNYRGMQCKIADYLKDNNCAWTSW
jgi:hypothetical protein